MEEKLAIEMLEYLVKKHGIETPKLEIKDTPKGMLGYYHPVSNTIVLNPNAPVEVLIHSFAFALTEAKKLTLGEAQDEREFAWKFVNEEIKEVKMA